MPQSTMSDQQKREQGRRRRMIGGVVGLVLVMAIAGFVLTRSGEPAVVTAAAAGTSEYGVTMGPVDAPHSIVIYEDFLCPFCAQLEAGTHDELAALAAQGQVLVDYRPFELLRPDYSGQALNAFKVVLETSGVDVALAFHAVLFAEQPDESGTLPGVDWLVERAVEAGAVETEVRPGIENMSQQAWIDAATKAAQDTGLEGTPTVLLDGKVFTQGQTMQDRAAALLSAVR